MWHWRQEHRSLEILQKARIKRKSYKGKKKKRIADPCHGWKQGRDIIAHRSWCLDLYPDPNFRGHISNHF